MPPVSGGAKGGLGDLIALPAKIDFLMRSKFDSKVLGLG